jgi:hypothetical protein
MKWLSHDWHQGRLSDAQYEEVMQDYRAHMAALRPHLSGDERASSYTCRSRAVECRMAG